MWAPHLAHKLVHRFFDNETVVAIFQAGRDRDEFIQACAREVWPMYTSWDITLVVGHIPGAQFTNTADALSHCNGICASASRTRSPLSQNFKGDTLHPILDKLFLLSTCYGGGMINNDLYPPPPPLEWHFSFVIMTTMYCMLDICQTSVRFKYN